MYSLFVSITGLKRKYTLLHRTDSFPLVYLYIHICIPRLLKSQNNQLYELKYTAHVKLTSIFNINVIIERLPFADGYTHVYRVT